VNATIESMTPVQAEILARAARNPDGVRVRGAGRQAAAAVLERAGFGRLAAFSPGGRFYINAAGRAAIQEAIVHAEAEAARYLGNANSSVEVGYTLKAERLYAKSTAWLDVANELRNQGASGA
jgi:uncharacterized phage protein gp47/JayE